MPWPMIHFAIAEKLYNHEPSPAFLLGSIAPDAIHSRENTNRQDKNLTHLCKIDGSMPDLVTLQNFCKTNLMIHEEPDWKAFVLGYASHVFADLRWTESVWEDYKIFSLLAKSKEYSIEPWLTGKEISQYREKTINWLSNTMNEPRITPKYITEDIVREFIKTTTHELRSLIKDMYI